MSKPKVFMIMPFQDEYFEAYEMLKERFSNDFDFAHAGDDVNTQQNILKDIVQMIFDADVIIADLTDLNSNVFYELGVAHALNKKVIAITQNISQLPFDIKSYRATEYSVHFRRFDNLIKELDRYLRGAIDGTVAFGNPVTDFLSTVNASAIQKIYNQSTDVEDSIGEDGFIDFLADIEEKVQTLTDTISYMTDDLNTMTEGIEKGAKEIDRVQKTGGGNSAAFVRKVARKIAENINDFTIKLKDHNSVYFDLWPQIEKNCLSLLENKHIDTPENKESLISFLKSLNAMQQAAITSSAQTSGMMDSFKNSKGMQRALNQAINSLETDMKQFLEFMSQMNASIDRILDKSKFVVGTVDFSDNSDDLIEE